MKPTPQDQPPQRPLLAWLCVALAGVFAPAMTMLLALDGPSPAPLAPVGGAAIAVGLMGAGMIGAAVGGRLWIGVLLALLTGASLVMLARMLEVPDFSHPFSIALAILVASISFAARGALFARRTSDKGWWIAMAVLAGEAAIVVTALAEPDMLPGWLLALLPAQWANIAIQSSLAGNGVRAASSALIALGGTAAATMLVVWLWPRRWTYLIMFTAWLSLSALVYQSSEILVTRVDKAIVASEDNAGSFRVAAKDTN